MRVERVESRVHGLGVRVEGIGSSFTRQGTFRAARVPNRGCHCCGRCRPHLHAASPFLPPTSQRSRRAGPARIRVGMIFGFIFAQYNLLLTGVSSEAQESRRRAECSPSLAGADVTIARREIRSVRCSCVGGVVTLGRGKVKTMR